MSPELKQFYQTVQQWVEEGCSSEHPYLETSLGLCDNLIGWGFAKEYPANEIRKLSLELRSQFQYAGLDRVYPFNIESCRAENYDDPWYSEEHGSHHCYTNLKRLAWIKEHAE